MSRHYGQIALMLSTLLAVGLAGELAGWRLMALALVVAVANKCGWIEGRACGREPPGEGEGES